MTCGSLNNEKEEELMASKKKKRAWNRDDVSIWAGRAKPTSRFAAYILATGEERSTGELNCAATAAGFDGSIGAIVGGIKAYATNKGLVSPLEDRDVEGRHLYSMCKKLRKWFLHEFNGSHEEALAHELPNTGLGNIGLAMDPPSHLSV